MPNTSYVCIYNETHVTSGRKITNPNDHVMIIKEGDEWEAKILNSEECKLLIKL